MRILDFADGFESSVEPTSVSYSATGVSVTPTGNLSSTDAQAALVELQGDIDGHDTRITQNESDISAAQADILALDSRLDTDETTLTDHDTRLTALEATPDQLLVNDQVSTPTTPASGKLAIYSKSKKLYYLDDGGIEKQVGSGAGSGGVNYLDSADSDFESGTGSWTTDNGAGFPATALSITSETTSPLRGSKSLKISKSAASASGEYVYALTTTIDSADRGKVLWGSLEGDFSHANYASGDLTIAAYDITNGALIPAYVEGGTSGAFNSGKGQYIFRVATSTTTAEVQLRIKGNSTSALAWDVLIDDVKLGPQEYVIGSVSGRLPSYVPTLTSSGGGVAKGTTTRDVAYCYREGKYLNVSYFYTQSAAGTAGTGYYEWSLPSGLTVDTDYQVTGVGGAREVAQSIAGVQVGTNFYDGYVLISSASKFAILCGNSATAMNNVGSTASGFIGDVSTATVSITAQFRIPIAQWTDDAVLSNSRLEYVYNSSTTTSDDTTSFAYGQDGAAIPSFAPAGAASVTKRVRCMNGNSGPAPQIELYTGTGWVPNYFGFSTSDDGSTYYGVRILPVTGSTTDYNVQFFSKAYPSSAWSTFSGWKWRVVKSANPLAVETAPKEYKAATSSVKSGTGSANYLSMVGNKVTLPPGVWLLSGFSNFTSAANTIQYTRLINRWATENGTDTGTGPAALTLDAGAAESADIQVSFTSGNGIKLSSPPARVTLTTTTDVYLVPYFSGSNATDARVTTYIYAERIS